MKKTLVDASAFGLVIGFLLGIFGVQIGSESTLDLVLFALIMSVLCTLYYHFITREKGLGVAHTMLFAFIFCIMFLVIYLGMSFLAVSGV